MFDSHHGQRVEKIYPLISLAQFSLSRIHESVHVHRSHLGFAHPFIPLGFGRLRRGLGHHGQCGR
jgi:hypothetical protein